MTLTTSKIAARCTWIHTTSQQKFCTLNWYFRLSFFRSKLISDLNIDSDVARRVRHFGKFSKFGPRLVRSCVSLAARRGDLGIQFDGGGSLNPEFDLKGICSLHGPSSNLFHFAVWQYYHLQFPHLRAEAVWELGFSTSECVSATTNYKAEFCCRSRAPLRDDDLKSKISNVGYADHSGLLRLTCLESWVYSMYPVHHIVFLRIHFKNESGPLKSKAIQQNVCWAPRGVLIEC